MVFLREVSVYNETLVSSWSYYHKRGGQIHRACHKCHLYLMLFDRMRLVLSKALFFVVMMSPCIGSGIEGECSITSIEYCDDTFNSSSGIAYLKCDFTASTEDHLKTPRCSTLEKGNNYEFCRGNNVERVDRRNDSFCANYSYSPLVPAYFCDISNCKENSYCNASDFNDSEESRESTCLCYDNGNEENLNPLTFKFLKLFWLVFIGVGQLLIVLPIIMFFNINLVSGTSRSFVFFYQCLPLAFPIGEVSSLIVMQNHIYSFVLSISGNAISSPNNHALVSPYYFLEYFKYILSIIAIVLVLFLVKCNWCPFQKCRLPWAKLRRATRHFREKHTAKRTILHGIGSVIVLAYGDLVSISFRILSGGPIIMPSCCMAVNYYYNNRTYIYSDHCLKPKACPDVTFLQTRIQVFFSIACVVVILLLLLPMALIYSPSIPTLFHKLRLPRFSKLHPVFDVFQGVYKDKLRWYAGLHLLYLVVLWSLYAGLATKVLTRHVVLSFSFLAILGIHSMIQPYKEPKHNYYESLLLYLNVLASLVTVLSNFFQLSLEILISFNILSTYMGSLPILIYGCYKSCKKRTCCRFSKCCQVLHPTRPESKDEDENDDGGDPLPERLPYHAASEMM